MPSESPITPTSGGPSVKPGQLDWVTPVKHVGELKRWIQKFRFGADMYLTEEVYPDPKKRDIAYVNALLRASGTFTEMEGLVLLLHSNGRRCDDLLKGLENHFLPAMEAERTKAAVEFTQFQRGQLSLLQAFRTLGKKLLECGRLGYKPDKMTIETYYKRLLNGTEKANYRTYLAQVDSAVTDAQDRMLMAIEAMGIDLEETNLSPNNRGAETTGLDFAGYGQGGRRGGRGGGGPRRKGLAHDQAPPATHPPQGNQQQQQQRPACRNCASKHCQSMQPGKGPTACKAHGQKCNYCGIEGHFANSCPKKAKDQSTAAKKKALAAKQAALAALPGF
jgi:hypothetical protein